MADDTFPFTQSFRSTAHRGSLRIPRDQACLLDRADSWITHLQASNNRLGTVNLPTNVLTSLLDFHRHRHLKQRKDGNQNEISVPADMQLPATTTATHHAGDVAGSRRDTQTIPTTPAQDQHKTSKGGKGALDVDVENDNENVNDVEHSESSSPEVLVSSWSLSNRGTSPVHKLPSVRNTSPTPPPRPLQLASRLNKPLNP